ncbi:MAG: FAD-dependent thymidylate synthase [Geminicoccaceae bacterium]
MALNDDQLTAIEDQRAQTFSTRRTAVPALEEFLYKPLPVLDHGFIRVIDYMGDDSAIVQAARVSYGTGTKAVRNDAGLINYLLRHRHTTPFEMCEIKFHIKLPIFIARQWIRHRTANVNEYSARYSILGDDFYLPDEAEIQAQSQSNRQGRAEPLPPDQASAVRRTMDEHGQRSYQVYQELLGEENENAGVARELARAVLPLNTYTQWYWKIDLHNLMHFIALRIDSHAQYEIRAYAERLMEVVEQWVPITAAAFRNHRVEGASLSGAAMSVLRRRLAGETVDQESSGLSVREWKELEQALNSSL